ncbi:MAG: NADH-quinone oxidoreductase subunit C, partial [Anaerolineae bacterium]
MTDFARLQFVLTAAFAERVIALHIRRGNELHCQIERGAAPSLAQLLRADFQTELALMVANDRSADLDKLEVHYLFVNDRHNWFLHATEQLPLDDLTIPSMATFYYPTSRFEREIKDLFGIEAVGQPDRRPLVRHGFWPESYHPLRKDATPP